MKRRNINAIMAALFFAVVGAALPVGSASATDPILGGLVSPMYCGAGSWVKVASYKYTFVYRSGTANYCGLTFNPYWNEKRTQISVSESSNGVTRRDSGSYWFYAGPVKVTPSLGYCATYYGAISGASVLNYDATITTVCNFQY